MKIQANEIDRTFNISAIRIADRYPMAFISLRRISSAKVVERGGVLSRISGNLDNAKDANLFKDALDILWIANQTIEGLAEAKVVAQTVVAQFSPVSPALATISWSSAPAVVQQTTNNNNNTVSAVSEPSTYTK